jgi:hypothetical protein
MRRELVFPQVRGRARSGSAADERAKCVKMCLAILVEGHNKRQGVGKSFCEVGMLGWEGVDIVFSCICCCWEVRRDGVRRDISDLESKVKGASERKCRFLVEWYFRFFGANVAGLP